MMDKSERNEAMEQLPIRSIRRRLNLTGIEVAEKLNITPQYYYDIEKGERGLSGRILYELSKIFGVSTDCLLGKEKLTVMSESDINNLIEENKRLKQQIQALKSLIEGW